ncbi:MAG: CofH family radical SAM protein [Syntrophobacterales bacterium]|nr:CofH family radical SAM protein [Syntrophobacterales bacterium]
MNELNEKIYAGKRLSAEEALNLFDWDILELGRAADFRTRLAVPGAEVGFIIDRIINFTNVCEAECSFCAFHARAGQIEPYELTNEVILSKVAELVESGGTQVMLQGGLNPRYALDDLTAMVRAIKDRFPGVTLHSFSPAELVYAARRSGFSVAHVIEVLKEAGLDSVPGASDILVERVRKLVSPRKISVGEWVETMESLHRCGLKSSATMTYGLGETRAERIAHLSVIRGLQDRTGMIRAFIPWSFSPAQTRMENVAAATGMDYLRIVAIARIFLDNVRYLQAGWLTEGMKMAQLALTMGANDMGGVLTEEVVVGATGLKNKTSMDEMIDIIRDAGRIPIQRDSDYRQIRSFA